MDAEEQAYPRPLKDLPIAWSSQGLVGFDRAEHTTLLSQLFHEGIPEAGYHLKDWANNHALNKLTWAQSVDEILKGAMLNGTLGNKAKFVQSLDLRLCNELHDAIGNLDKKENHDKKFFESIRKVHRIHEKMDTHLLKGIYLSSLIMWYDYVVAAKKINPSDMADIFHALLYPYCSIVIADASRVDSIKRIQREDKLYQSIQCYGLRDFIARLSD